MWIVYLLCNKNTNNQVGTIKEDIGMSKDISELWNKVGADEELLISVGINKIDDEYVALIMGQDAQTNQINYTVKSIDDVVEAFRKYITDDII